jgi:hypothetical protein
MEAAAASPVEIKYLSTPNVPTRKESSVTKRENIVPPAKV